MTLYCLASDIQKRMKGDITFSTTTSPKLEAVNAMITAHSAVMDGVLNGRYQTPITGAAALEILRLICVYLVLGELNPIIAGGLGTKEGPKPVDYSKMGNELLTNVVEGRLALLDAETNESSDFVNNNVANSREFTMKKDEVQW